MKKTKARSAKRSFFMSVLSLILCFTMLIGTTWAWFTDSVTSGVNKIVAGNLDIEVTHSNANVTDEDVTGNTSLFRDKDGNEVKWEPGVIAYENFKVKNAGTLALKYNLTLNVADYNSVVVDDVTHDLREVLQIYVSNTPFSGDRIDAQGLTYAGTVGDFSRNGVLLAQNATDTYAVVIYWNPGISDNIYNINNTKEVLTSLKGVTKEACDNKLFVDFGINVFATQMTHEADSFDNQYDKLPDIWTEVNAFGNLTVSNAKGEGGEGDIYVKDESESPLVSATIPGVPFGAIDSKRTDFQYKSKKDDAAWTVPDVSDGHDEEIALKVKPETITDTSAKYDITLRNVTKNCPIELINKVMEIEMKIGAGLSSVAVSHNGVPMTEAASKANQTYSYNSTTGIVTIYTDSFSPYEITWSDSPFNNNLKVTPIIGTDILRNKTNFGLMEDDIIRLVTGDDGLGVDDFNALAHGVTYVAGAEGTTEDDKLLLMNARSYQAPNEEGYLQDDGKYQYWKGDFVIKFSKEITAFDENSPDNCIILAGEYGDWGWLKIPIVDSIAEGLLSDGKLGAGTEIRLLDTVGISINYKELCTQVKTFNCGAAYIKEDYNVNDPLVMTIEFRMYETYDLDDPAAGGSTNTETGKYITVDTYTYTFNN